MFPPGQAWPSFFLQPPTPSQLFTPTHVLAGLLSVPLSAMFVQVPRLPPMLHAWHVPQEAALQQTPSTQLPLEHSPPIAHAWPFVRSAQAPAPLQLVTPAHSFAGSSPFAMFEHVPMLPAMLHALQLVAHEVLQHTPSTQNVLRHSVPSEQAAPFGPPTHTAAPLQTCAPVHSLAGS